MTESKQTKLYLPGKEAASYLGLHETTFYRRQEKHPLIPEVQIGDVKGYTEETLR